MSEIANVITAICAVLGIIGGLIMWFQRVIQARMPDIDFQIIPQHGFKQANTIIKVILLPKRITFPYYIETIKSSIPLYSDVVRSSNTIGGVPILDETDLSLSAEYTFSLEAPFFVVPSQRFLKSEPQLSFYIDSRLFNNGVHKINVHLRSEHFPFRWGKFIVLSV